jgi:hypothetical protein
VKVELLNITPDALNLIGKYASICYNSKDEREVNIKRAVAVKDKYKIRKYYFVNI